MGKVAKSSGMLPWLGLALLIFLIDQLTKVLILGSFEHGQAKAITSFFNLVRVHNSGAAFSFLADASGCAPIRHKSCFALRWPASWAAPSATRLTACCTGM